MYFINYADYNFNFYMMYVIDFAYDNNDIVVCLIFYNIPQMFNVGVHMI